MAGKIIHKRIPNQLSYALNISTYQMPNIMLINHDTPLTYTNLEVCYVPYLINNIIARPIIRCTENREPITSLSSCS